MESVILRTEKNNQVFGLDLMATSANRTISGQRGVLWIFYKVLKNLLPFEFRIFTVYLVALVDILSYEVVSVER